MLEKHLFISGEVQGVGFRSAVKRYADQHQVRGFARNLPDGRVEICAQGTEEQLDAFIQAVRKRPGLGKIDHLEERTRESKEVYSSFKILH